MARGDGKITLSIVVSSLYMLSLIAVLETALTVYLFVKRDADSTIEIGLIFVFASSLLSIFYGSLHALLAKRHRAVESGNLPRTSFYSFTNFMPRVLITAWMASAAAGLVVAVRQPACLTGSEGSNSSWKFGTTCEIHRASVGLAVAALIVSCALFCAVEISSRPYHASFNGIFVPAPEPNLDFGPTPGSSWSSTSSEDSLKIRKFRHNRIADLEMEAGRNMYLQRRNSLSSQAALHPPGVRTMRMQSSPIPSRASSTPSTIIHHNPHHSTVSSRTSSSSSSDSLATTLRSSYSSGTTLRTYSSSTPSRSISSVSSLSYSPSKKSPLSAMRRISEPEVPAIPDKFLAVPEKSLSVRQELQVPPKLYFRDVWSLGNFEYTPLSADPQIRAFSLETILDEKPVPASPRTALTSHPTSDKGVTKLTSPTPAHGKRTPSTRPDMPAPANYKLTPTIRPDIPARAKGHVARQVKSDGNLRSRPILQASTAPGIAVPSLPQQATQAHPAASPVQRPVGTSDAPAPLKVRKIRSSPQVPQTTSNPDSTKSQHEPLSTISNWSDLRVPKSSSKKPSSNKIHTQQQRPPTPVRGSGRGNPITTTTTTTNNDNNHRVPSTSHSLLEHQRLRARFERARAREAVEYGMGPWHKQQIPNQSTVSLASTIAIDNQSQASLVHIPSLTKDKSRTRTSRRSSKKSSSSSSKKSKRKSRFREGAEMGQELLGGLRIVT